MNSRKGLNSRQDQAEKARVSQKGFAGRGFARTLTFVKLCLVNASFFSAAFRNPSPWRQSGATLHLLPPFFISAAYIHNSEREIKCSDSQKSLLHLSCPSPLQAVSRNRPVRFKVLQQVQQLVRWQVKLLVAATQTLQLVPFSAASLALLRPRTNNQHTQRFAPRLNIFVNAALPLWAGRRFAF